MTKQEAMMLCEKTWKEFQTITHFKHFPKVNVEFDLDRNSKNSFGQCRWFRNDPQRIVTIYKTHYENGSVDEVLNTIVHELCHAIDFKFSNHGQFWKSIALIAGRHFKTTINRCDQFNENEQQERRKSAIASLTCEKCSKEYLLFKRGRSYTTQGKGYYCGVCGRGHKLNFKDFKYSLQLV
jgi:predicted SprT family Zn-dependent metalloprotease